MVCLRLMLLCLYFDIVVVVAGDSFHRYCPGVVVLFGSYVYLVFM